MFRFIFQAWLYWLLLSGPVAHAEDIEAVLPAASNDGVYLHILMDLGDTARDTTICLFAVNCGPPFVSEAVHRQLALMYLPGESVTGVGVFKAVLAAVLEGPRLNHLQVSLAISNHGDNPSADPALSLGGGTLLQGFQPLMHSRSTLLKTLVSIPQTAGSTAHVFQPKESLFEWLRYIRGDNLALGTNTAGNFGLQKPFPDYDNSVLAGGRYLSPFSSALECPRLNVLIFALDTAADDDDLDAMIRADLPISGQFGFEDLLTSLHASSVDLLPGLQAKVPLARTLTLSSSGRAGMASSYAAAIGQGGVLLVDRPRLLERQLREELSRQLQFDALSAGTVFVEDSFHPGRILEDAFIAMSAPDRSNTWRGNVKKLKLRRRTATGASGSQKENFEAVDAGGKSAFSIGANAPDRLRFDALTFWTDPVSLPPGDGVRTPVDADGYIVDRGGAGQKIDGLVHSAIGDTNSDTDPSGFSVRQLFYEAAVGSQILPFDADPSSAIAMRSLLDPAGSLSDRELLALIRWGRGQPGVASSRIARDWLLGDILHSKPYALNYGATPGYSRANPNVRLFFGSNDGLFRILENTDKTGGQSGREIFALYLHETLDDLLPRYRNTLPWDYHIYGVDGSPVALKIDKNRDGTIDYRAGDRAIVYFGMRRGGSSYYALEVSDPDAVPRMLWKISRTTGGAFDELGKTFSKPIVGRVNYDGQPRDVLIFGGGYDGGWQPGRSSRVGKDLDPGDDSVGNAIYIVDAYTGTLVWKAVLGTTARRSDTHFEHAGMVDSIPSEVSAIRRPNGVVHRLYVGDTGGSVWRVDLPENLSGNAQHRRDSWFVSKLADLGTDQFETGGSAADDRRFFHAPDLVTARDIDGDFDGVVIQSGDRAHPEELSSENYLFYIKDREVKTGSHAVSAENTVSLPAGRISATDLLDQTSCITGAERVPGSASPTPCRERDLSLGWKMGFTLAGEKGLSSPMVDGGRVYATTYVPGDKTVCPIRRGKSLIYAVYLATATAVKGSQRFFDIGPGLPDDVMRVEDSIYIPGSGIDLYDLDGDGSNDVSNFLPGFAPKLYGLYWLEPGADSL